MKILIVDTVCFHELIPLALAFTESFDTLIYSKNITVNEYNLKVVNKYSLSHILDCYKPNHVLLIGDIDNINNAIDTMILNKPNSFFISTLITNNQANVSLDKIIRNSIYVFSYDENLINSIEKQNNKQITHVKSNEEIINKYKISKNQSSYQIVVRNTKYGTMSYVANDVWFISDLVNGNTIFEAALIEEHLLKIVKESKYIFDIGAHAGSHTIVYSHFNSDACIFSFEPQTVMFNTLNFNIKNNKRNKIRTFNVALGKEVGILRLSKSISDGPNEHQDINFDSQNYYNLGGMQIGTDGEEVYCDVLDNYDYGGCDFIKIDVEGFEALVLAGGINLIKKYRPIIFFECNNKTVKNEVRESLKIKDDELDTFAFLRSVGYKNFKQINNDNYLAKFDSE